MENQKFKITAVCESNHTQDLHTEGLDRKWAEVQAGLLDGSLLAVPPGPDSIIGKCGICNTPIKCTVTEE